MRLLFDYIDNLERMLIIWLSDSHYTYTIMSEMSLFNEMEVALFRGRLCRMLWR